MYDPSDWLSVISENLKFAFYFFENCKKGMTMQYAGTKHEIHVTVAY